MANILTCVCVCVCVTYSVYKIFIISYNMTNIIPPSLPPHPPPSLPPSRSLARYDDVTYVEAAAEKVPASDSSYDVITW